MDPQLPAPTRLQGIVLPAFETIDDGEEGKKAAVKAIASECWGCQGGGRAVRRLLACSLACARAACWPSRLPRAHPPTQRSCRLGRPQPPPAAGREALHELFKRGELRGFHMDHYNRVRSATYYLHTAGGALLCACVGAGWRLAGGVWEAAELGPAPASPRPPAGPPRDRPLALV